MAYSVIDPNRDAIFEAMRRQSNITYVLKRHEDLRKQCERELLMYDKAKRLTDAQFRRSQAHCVNRMKTLFHRASRASNKRPNQTPLHDVTATACHQARTRLYDVTGTKARGFRADTSGRSGTKSAPSSALTSNTASTFNGRERFLFRVLFRNGKEVYIRDETEAEKSRQLLNGISCDDVLITSSRRTRSARQ